MKVSEHPQQSTVNLKTPLNVQKRIRSRASTDKTQPTARENLAGFDETR